MQNAYEVITSFFDYHGLDGARTILSKTIKTADKKGTWKKSYPAELLYFTDRMQELIEASFFIIETFDCKPEVQLAEEDGLWFLTDYTSYCGWHIHATPWDFFPRYLSKKEFLDPYKAIKKFTRYRSLASWKLVVKELLECALSPNSIAEFEDGTSIMGTWLHLHKLVEATHLIEIRSEDKVKRPRHKWKDRENLLAGNQQQESSNQ